jgi:Na+-transporting NADH:ubiquinone oxidoreductase subunit A
VSESSTLECKNVSRVALLGRDFRSVNFELLCQQGDQVSAGNPLMRDARRQAISFNAPLSGRVARVERGARRKLVSLQIEVDASIAPLRLEPPRGKDRESIRAFMLESGAWSSLRTRPFGNIPDPDAEPTAIFVTTLDNESFAPEPRPIIEAFADEFNAAVEVLASISETPLYVCHAQDHPLKFAGPGNVSSVPFPDDYAAGLPGFHINRLCPIGFGGGEVWHIGYQDVIALGHLLLRGSPWPHRVISLSGEAVKNPRKLCVAPGALIEEILEAELEDGAHQILAGSFKYDRPLTAGQAFLGAGQRQICVLNTTADSSTNAQNYISPIMPGDRLEALAPSGIYPVPLMRALQLGDVERARELGALELVEEDLAGLSSACVSNSDYGALLRVVLDQLEAARA